MQKAIKGPQLFGFSRSASQFLFLLGFLFSPGSLGQMAALPLWNQCKEAGKVIKVFKDPTLIEGFSLPAGCQQFRFKIWGSGGGGGAGALRNTNLVDGGYGGAGAFVELRMSLNTTGTEAINVKLGDGGGGGPSISVSGTGKIVGNGGGGGGATFIDLTDASGTTNTIAIVGGAGGGGGAGALVDSITNSGGNGAPTKIGSVSHGDVGISNHSDSFGRGATGSGVGVAPGPTEGGSSGGSAKNGGQGGSPTSPNTRGASGGSVAANSGAGGTGGAALNDPDDSASTYAGGGGGGGGAFGAGGGRVANSGGAGGSGGGAGWSVLYSISSITLVDQCNASGAEPWTACQELPDGVSDLPTNIATGGAKGAGKIRNGASGNMSNNPGGKGGQGLVLLYVDR